MNIRRKKTIALLLTAMLSFQTFSGTVLAETEVRNAEPSLELLSETEENTDAIPEAASESAKELEVPIEKAEQIPDESIPSESIPSESIHPDQTVTVLPEADEVNASYYTVRYDAKEGTDAPSSVRVNAGNSYSITGIPHYFAHNFMGWTAYTDDTAHKYLGSYSPKEKITVNSNIVLEAIWYRPEIISAADLDSGIYESTVSFPVANASRWYKITTPSEFSGWRFESESSENSSNMDPVITIYEADGTKVAEHDDCSMRDYDFCLDSHILYTDTTYYLEFSNGFLDRTASFDLTIRKGYVIRFLDKDRQNLPNLRTFKYHDIDAELPFDYPQVEYRNFEGWTPLGEENVYLSGEHTLTANKDMTFVATYTDPEGFEGPSYGSDSTRRIPTTGRSDYWYRLYVTSRGFYRIKITGSCKILSATIEEYYPEQKLLLSVENKETADFVIIPELEAGSRVSQPGNHFYYLHLVFEAGNTSNDTVLTLSKERTLNYHYNDVDATHPTETIAKESAYLGDVIHFPTPTRAGYEFDGWYTYAGFKYTDGYTISGDTLTYDFYAHWKPAEGRKLPFVDVPKDAYYYDAVALAYENGIANGTDATHFSPNANCTRGQVVTFLWRAMGSPEPKTTVNPFVDVKSTSPFYKAILWAYDNDITKGTDANHFSPDAPVTRAQFVTFLWRNEDCPDPETTVNPFVDVDPSSGFYKAILWAYDNNITKGTDAKHFAPNQTCTRAQVIAFIYRAYFS